MPQEQRPTEKFRTSVGGQALMEGIMMRGPEKICCAVRRPDGTIDLSYSDVTTHWYNKVPLVRGVCNMVENLMNGYKYLMHSADIAMTEEEKEEEKQNESKCAKLPLSCCSRWENLSPGCWTCAPELAAWALASAILCQVPA